jgi:hypothetical protein
MPNIAQNSKPNNSRCNHQGAGLHLALQDWRVKVMPIRSRGFLGEAFAGLTGWVRTKNGKPRLYAAEEYSASPNHQPRFVSQNDYSTDKNYCFSSFFPGKDYMKYSRREALSLLCTSSVASVAILEGTAEAGPSPTPTTRPRLTDTKISILGLANAYETVDQTAARARSLRALAHIARQQQLVENNKISPQAAADEIQEDSANGGPFRSGHFLGI